MATPIDITKHQPILKTITLGDDEDNPNFSICPGHVSAAVFNKAFQAEGWADEGEHTDEDLRHEYLAPTKNDGWEKTEKGDPNGFPVTVSDW